MDIAAQRNATFARAVAVKCEPRRGIARAAALLATASLVLGATQSAIAETMFSALVRAYNTNPKLSRDRANVRVHDEGVAKAWSGLRPSAGAQGSVGPQSTEFKFPIPDVRIPLTERASASLRSIRSTASASLYSSPFLEFLEAGPSTSRKRSSTAVEPRTPSARLRRASSPRAPWRSSPSR